MDVDIDFANRAEALAILKHIPASRKTETGFVAHNSGVYFQNIPCDSITNLASIDYKEADTRGYFKIDFLNLSLYKDINSEEHLIKLCNIEPMWELLEHKEIVENLFQISNHYELVSKLKPNSIEQLAAVIALIRPGKKHLINKSWDDIMKEVWTKDINNDDSGYVFKKAHSFSYAMAIVVQLNLLCELSALGQSD